MTNLNGKTALITGSVQGIGLAIATEMAKAGARIAVHGIAGDAQIDAACKSLCNAGAPQAKFFGADMQYPDQIADLMRGVTNWGGADILVNNAGIQHVQPIESMPTNKWDAILAINLSAAFHTMQHAMPIMAERGYGRVVNISSVHGLIASPEKAPYTAAKFGLIGLSKVGALEYAQSGSRESGGVTVNCICPGWTETEIIEPQIAARSQMLGVDRQGAISDLLSEKQPSRRTNTPQEIGALAVWLCSTAAHNITGTSIPMDGGWTSQ